MSEHETDVAGDAVPALSVIVPVRDGGADLVRLLEALDRQTIGPARFEVVIGDDGSTDGGTDRLGDGDGRIRVVRGPRKTGYAARNRAAAAARAPILAFCDADCVPEPRWLEAGLEAMASADVVGGMIRSLLRGEPTIWTLVDMDTFVDAERAIRAGGLLTGNFFVRRQLFQELGGFDESLLRTGDFEFASRCHRSGARVVYGAEAIVSHPTYNSARPFMRKFWAVNRWYAWREARAGRRPYLVRVRSWVPFVQTMRTRRGFGRPLGLDTERFARSGVSLSRVDRLVALPIIYLFLPYTANSAQLAGWLSGRKLAPAGSSEISTRDDPAQDGFPS